MKIFEHIKMYFTNILLTYERDGSNTKYYEVTCDRERHQQNYQISIGDIAKFELPPSVVERTSLSDIITAYVTAYVYALKEKYFKGYKDICTDLLNAIKIIDSCGKSRLFVYNIERPFDTSVTLLQEIKDDCLIRLTPSFSQVSLVDSDAIYKAFQDNNIEVAKIE